jgi:hypothetical protein
MNRTLNLIPPRQRSLVKRGISTSITHRVTIPYASTTHFANDDTIGRGRISTFDICDGNQVGR